MIHYLTTFQVNEIEKQLNAIRDNIKIGEDRAARLDRKMEDQQVIIVFLYRFSWLNHMKLLLLDYLWPTKAIVLTYVSICIYYLYLLLM